MNLQTDNDMKRVLLFFSLMLLLGNIKGLAQSIVIDPVRNRRTGKCFCLYLSNFFFTINHHKNRITVLRQFHQLGMLKD